MNIRQRKHAGGSSWQLDCGFVNGKRVQLSFKTRAAAEEAAAKHREACKTKARLPFEKMDALAEKVAEFEALQKDLDLARKRIAELEGRLEVLKTYESVLLPPALEELRGALVIQSVPRFCGVYFLLREGVVVYVGQATSVFRRVHDHLAEGLKSFDAVAWYAVPPERLHAVERVWIKKLRPEYNVQSHPLRS